MHNSNDRYDHPAVPPLYPMDPCRRKPYYYDDNPIYYEPGHEHYDTEPIYHEPYYPHYPHQPVTAPMPPMDYPMMDPYFRECMEVCMRMKCGHYPPHHGYSSVTDYSYEDYEKFKYIDLHKLSPYYTPEEEE